MEKVLVALGDSQVYIHCRTLEELDVLKKDGMNEAVEAFKHIPTEITTTPYTVFAEDFKTEFGFAYFMSLAGNHFKTYDDVMVRYAKPEDDEDGSIKPCVQILKSKAKLFYKYMVENNPVLAFFANSNKELKEIAKKLNSFGVKDTDEKSASEFMLSQNVPASFSLYYDSDNGYCAVDEYDMASGIDRMTVASLKEYFEQNIFQ